MMTFELRFFMFRYRSISVIRLDFSLLIRLSLSRMFVCFPMSYVISSTFLLSSVNSLDFLWYRFNMLLTQSCTSRSLRATLSLQRVHYSLTCSHFSSCSGISSLGPRCAQPASVTIYPHSLLSGLEPLQDITLFLHTAMCCWTRVFLTTSLHLVH